MRLLVRLPSVLAVLLVSLNAACSTKPWPPESPASTDQPPQLAASNTPTMQQPTAATLANVSFATETPLPGPTLRPRLPAPTAFRIAYSQASTDPIYVIRADGSDLTAINGVTPTSHCSGPSWSFDGTQLAFSCYDAITGNSDLFVSDLLGTGLTRLTSSPTSDRQPLWSPYGERIAFATEEAGGRSGWDLALFDFIEPGVTVLASSQPTWSGATEVAFDWAPDGQRLTFHESAEDRIYVVNLDGTGQRRLPPTLARQPDWSPVDDRIAYIAEEGLAVIDLQGETSVLLIRRHLLYTPRWSPDGRAIAVQDFSEDGGLIVHILDSRETREFLQGTPVLSYCWAPDSARIAFVGPGSHSLVWYIYILDTQTANVTAVGPIDPDVFHGIACQP
jgi:Tol biopolymer transport system component